MLRLICSIILPILVLGVSREELTVHHLSKTQSLFQFKFQDEVAIDFESPISNLNFFSRTILENLHVKGGVRQVYISVALGRLNPVLSQGVVAPTHGTTIISNGDVQREIMINQLSEIFRIAKHTLLEDKAYSMFMNTKGEITYQTLGFPEGVNIYDDNPFYAQEPTDIVCIDAIETIKQYLGCNGKAGIFAAIDQNSIFQSSYVSVQGFFQYDQLKKVAKQEIVILAQLPSSEIPTIFKSQSIRSCQQVEKSLIHHTSRQIVFNFQQALVFQLNALQRQANDHEQPLPMKSNILSKSYISGEWFSFTSHYNHWIQAQEDGVVKFQAYFQRDFVPVFSTIRLEDENGQDLSDKFSLQVEINPHFKRVLVEGPLAKGETIFFQIRFNKKLKSFEEYPHDPERGHDIISFPITFTTQTGTYLYFTENHVTRLPAPDFSMPFNILTYTCLTLGYYFLQILQLSVDRFELNKKSKGSMIQRVIGFVWSQLRNQE